MDILLTVACILTVFYLLTSILSFFRTGGSGTASARRRMNALIATARGDGGEAGPDGDAHAVKERKLSGLPWLGVVLGRLTCLERLERLHRQAGVGLPLSVFILLGCVLFAGGYAAVNAVLGMPGAGLAAGAGLGLAPFVLLRVRRTRRLEAFERQLPDGLDLIARCLKAGHTFLSGIGMVAAEMDQPIGAEFSMVRDEINFGSSPREALAGLVSRIESEDLHMFVTALNIQSESGGNLADITESIADLIRQRFRFRRKVKVLSAEGRFSAAILILLPFVVFALYVFISPDSASYLYRERLGRIVCGITAALMLVGALVIRRMVTIRV